MLGAISGLDARLGAILDTNDPVVIQEHLDEIESIYSSHSSKSVPECAKPAQEALLTTLELGIQVAELKLQEASESEIQVAIAEMEASHEIFDAEYEKLNE